MIDFGQTQKSMYGSKVHPTQEQFYKPNGYKFSEQQIEQKKQKLIQKNNFFQEQEDKFEKLKKIKEGNWEALHPPEKNYNQQQIYHKLGIKPEPEPIVNTNQMLGDNLGIDEQYIHSTKIPGPRAQVSDQMVNDIESEIERIRQRRENLLSKKNYEKIQDQPYQYLHNRQQEQEQEENIDDIIRFKWKEEKPSLEEVEQKLQKNQEKLQQLQENSEFQLGQNRRIEENEDRDYLFLGNGENRVMVDDMLLGNDMEKGMGIHNDVLQYGGFDKSNIIATAEKKQQPKQEKTLIFQETLKQKQKRIVREEMQEIENRINQEAYEHYLNGTKPHNNNSIRNGVKKGSVREIPVGQKRQHDKLESYQLDREIQDIVKIKQKEGERKGFDRFRKADSFKKQQEFLETKNKGKLDKLEIPVARNPEEKQRQDVERGVEILMGGEQENNKQLQAYLEKLYQRILEDYLVYQKKKILKNEEFILRFIFMQIDKNNIQFVQKDEIFDRIAKDSEVLEYFSMVKETMYKDLQAFDCQRAGLYSFQEFCRFCRNQGESSLQSQKREKEEKMKEQLQEDEDFEVGGNQDEIDYEWQDGYCVLKENQVDYLRNVFNELDRYNDLIVDRVELIQKMKKDIHVQKILKRPAIKVPVTNKLVSLEGVLDWVREDYEQQIEERQRMNMEYLSWNQFYEYFTKFSLEKYRQTSLKNTNLSKKSKNLAKNNQNFEENEEMEPEIEVFDINEEDLEVLRDMFDMMPHVENEYVHVQDYVLSCKIDFQVQKIRENLCRLESFETKLGQENIGECMDRFIYEADEHCNWEELKAFMSRRGRPYDFVEKKQPNQNKENTCKSVNFEGQKEEFEGENKGFWVKFNEDSGDEFTYKNCQEDPEFRSEFLEEIENGLSHICRVKKEQIFVKKIVKLEKSIGVQSQIKIQGQQRSLNSKEKEQFLAYFPGMKVGFLGGVGENDYGEGMERSSQYEEFSEIKKKKFGEDEEGFQVRKFEFQPFDIEQIRTMKYQLKEKNEEQDLENEGKKQRKNQGNLTVPQPFGFDVEEKKKELGMTIRQKKMDSMIKSIKKEEEDALNYKFKANKIPIETQVPMYDNIVQKQKEKREKVKEQYKKIQEKTSCPFSFYERDMKKKRENIEKVNGTVQKQLKIQKKETVIKAREIPISSRQEMLPQLERQRKLKSEKNKEKRKKEMELEREKILKKKCPRMLEQETEFKKKMEERLNAKTHEQLEHCSHKPQITKYDFGKEKSVSEIKEERKTKGNSFIQAKPKPVKIHYLDSDNKKENQVENNEIQLKKDRFKEFSQTKNQKKFDFGDQKNCEETLKDLEQKFEWSRKGELYKQTGKKTMSADDIQLLNRLRKKVLDEEEAKKQVKIQEKKNKEKEEAKKVNDERLADEKEKMKEIKKQREAKLNSQPMNMERKQHGSSVLDKYRNKTANNNNGSQSQSQASCAQIEEVEDEKNKEKEEEEKLRKEQEEEEKKKKEEEEKEKEKERKKKEEEEKEKERERKEEEERQKEIQAEREKLKKNKSKDEEERLKKEQEEQERQEQEQQEFKEREKEEQLEKQKILEEQEKQQKLLEEQEKQKKIQEEQEKQKKIQEEQEKQKKLQEEQEKQRKLQEEQEKQKKLQEEQEKQKKLQEEQEKQKKLQEEEKEKQMKLQEEQEKQKKLQEEKEKEQEKLKKEQEQEQEEKTKLQKEKEEREKKLQAAKADLDKLNLQNPTKEEEKPKQPLRKQHTKIKDISEYLINVNPSSQNQKKEGENELFTDEIFKPDQSSLSKQNLNNFESAKSVKSWLRAKECIGQNVEIFQDKIEAKDILQGSLGDCYFLSSLSVIAEKQQGNLIKRLFCQQFVNKSGRYSVFLCLDGEWKEVVLDDYFACNEQKQLVFSRANGEEMWVQILEKGYGKVFGSYEKIEAGLCYEAIRDLTGADGKIMKNQTGKSEQESWKFILENIQKGYLLTAGSQSDDRGREIQQDSGIVSGHAYAVLNAVEIENNTGQLEKIVQMRNPWGQHEWKGDWSDKSGKWSEKSKKQVGLTDEDDGIFWMNIEDFCREYGDVSANMLHSDYYYSSKRVKFDQKQQGQAAYIDVEIEQDTECFFSLSQRDKRHYKNEKQEYKYSMGRVFVGKIDKQNKIQYVECSGGCDRNVFCEVSLKKGNKYRVYIDMEWLQSFWDEVVISYYGNNKVVNLEEFQLNFKDFSADLDELLQGIEVNKSENIEKIDENIVCKTVEKGGYMALVYNNESKNKKLEQEIELVNSENLELVFEKNDRNCKKFKVEVEPQSSKVVKFQIMAKGGGAYSFQTGVGTRLVQSFSDEELIQNAKNDPNAKDEREGMKVVCYTHLYSGGMVVYWENDNSDKVYYENIELNLKGLEGIGFNDKEIQKIKVEPKGHFMLKCKATGGALGCNPACTGIKLENSGQFEEIKDDDDDEYGDDDFEDEE